MNPEVKTAIADTLSAIVGWVTLAPLALLIPKKKGAVVIIGRQGGYFLDNAKHFYSYLHELQDRTINALFLSEHLSVVEELKERNAHAESFPSAKSIWCLLRAQVVVFDATDWSRKTRFQLCWRAKKVQLWHGAPLKDIELILFKKRLQRLNTLKAALLKFYKWILGRHAPYDLFISPSRFYTDNVFTRAINAKAIENFGYPRNDYLTKNFTGTDSLPALTLNSLDNNTLEQMLKKREQGYRLVLYAPTFRKTLKSPLSNGSLNLQTLNRNCSKQKIFFVVKLHPAVSNSVDLDAYDALIEYPATCDIYPIMSIFDAMVGDYSSMAFDFLLVNKPIYYFIYDLEDYIANDRELLFNFEESSPGILCKTQQALEKALMKLPEDRHQIQRKALLDKLFTVQDGSSSMKIWAYIKLHYIK